MTLLKGKEMVQNAFASKIFSLPSTKLEKQIESEKSSQSEHSNGYHECVSPTLEDTGINSSRPNPRQKEKN